MQWGFFKVTFDLHWKLAGRVLFEGKQSQGPVLLYTRRWSPQEVLVGSPYLGGSQVLMEKFFVSSVSTCR